MKGSSVFFGGCLFMRQLFWRTWLCVLVVGTGGKLRYAVADRRQMSTGVIHTPAVRRNEAYSFGQICCRGRIRRKYSLIVLLCRGVTDCRTLAIQAGSPSGSLIFLRFWKKQTDVLTAGKRNRALLDFSARCKMSCKFTWLFCLTGRTPWSILDVHLIHIS